MKRKSVKILLALVCVLMLAASVCLIFLPGMLGKALAFPFSLIASGMQALSSLGRVGTGLAAALWVGFSLLPLFPAFHHLPMFPAFYENYKDRSRWERVSWLILSVVLLFVLYGMASPGRFAYGLPSTDADSVRMTLGAAAWSAIVFCVLLRLIGGLDTADKLRVLRLLRGALMVLVTGIAAAGVYNCGGALYRTLNPLPNTAVIVYAVVRFLCNALPYVMDVLVIAAGLRLVKTLLTEEKEGLADAAKLLGRRCKIALCVTAGSVAAFNLFQAVFMKYLPETDTNVSLPLVSVVLFLIALLVSELLQENKRLQEDNDLFI